MTKELVQSNVNTLNKLLNQQSIQDQLRNALKESAGAFTASVVELFASDKVLQKCNPQKALVEVLKAATLKLPLNKSLGMAYIVPYKNKKTDEILPQFQLGYKGYIQLAMRTGQYRYLNADIVYEGQLKGRNHLTGEIDLSGEPVSEKVVGYFAYMELLNGFKKVVYWPKEKIMVHAKRYSKSYEHELSIWKTNFDEMALKTVLKALLSTYGILSVDMIAGFSSEATDIEEEIGREIAFEANQGEVIDITAQKTKTSESAKKEASKNEATPEEISIFDSFAEPGF